MMLLLIPAALGAQTGGGQQDNQKISIGIHADPLISWFSTDIDSVRNDGARSGFNFGLTLNYFFGPNYAISTGINLISAGGRLVSKRESYINLSHNKDLLTAIVAANEATVYKVQYLAVPVGLKLQTNQIGYVTFFTDLGVDPKVVIGNKVDIGNIENQKASEEVKNFNISYHVIAGIEYAVGGNTAVVLGLGFDNSFADLTKDLENGPFNQFIDKVSHKMISVRLGVNF